MYLKAAIAYIVDEVCKAIVKNLGPVCLKVPSSMAALPFLFLFAERSLACSSESD